MIRVAQRGGIHPEERPRGSGRARPRSPSPRPRRAAPAPSTAGRWNRAAVSQKRIHGAPGRNIGEGEALGGEPHLRPARVLERAQVGADAVVVATPSPGWNGSAPPLGGSGHRARPGPARTRPAAPRRRAAAPSSRSRPEHRRLLLDLAVAAEHRELRAPARGARAAGLGLGAEPVAMNSGSSAG